MRDGLSGVGHPPLDPSTELRVRGPTPGRATSRSPLQGIGDRSPPRTAPDSSRGIGMTWESGVGWLVRHDGLSRVGHLPLDPSTELRVRGPTPGRATSRSPLQGRGNRRTPVAAPDSSRGFGMTWESGVVVLFIALAEAAGGASRDVVGGVDEEGEGG